MTTTLTLDTVKVDATTTIVRLDGPLDAAGVTRLMAQHRTLTSEGYLHLILNLRGLTFLPSSGVGSLLALSEEYERRGGQVTLVHSPPEVVSIARVLNLTELLEFAESEEDALPHAPR